MPDRLDITFVGREHSSLPWQRKSLKIIKMH